MEHERLFTSEEAGQFFRKTGQTMRHWARTGKIAAYKVGRAYLFTEGEIKRLLRESEVKQP